MKDLQILQYNCGNANHKGTRPFFDSLDPRIHPIIAIQEPMVTERSKTTYCPKNYRLSRAVSPATRVVFLIHDKLPLTTWTVIEETDYVERLVLHFGNHTLNLINVYNPGGPPSQPRITVWPTLGRILEETADADTLILGDFNAHHPEWAGPTVAREPRAEHLLMRMGAMRFHLLNEEGEATWHRGQRQSVLDLGFASQSIGDKVMLYRPRPDWSLIQDHSPIEIKLSYPKPKQRKSKRFQIKSAEWGAIQEEVQQRGEWRRMPPHEGITQLQYIVEEVMEKHCPLVRSSDRANPDWSLKATELLQEARQARTLHRVTGSDESLEDWKRARNQLQREIRRNGRTRWRKMVADLTSNPENPEYKHNKGLWKLSTWSRKSTGEKGGATQIPPLRTNEQEAVKTTNADKAAILSAKFFPRNGQADTSDIESNQEFPRFQIDPSISKGDLEEVIRKLPNGKAPGPDRIPNEAWKMLNRSISGDLAEKISQILESGQILTSLKESTTVVLRKEKKKDYSLPSSYRPIALENTLAKIVEKVLANKITEEAEERGLLPWNQMGARKKRSTLSALELLTGSIQTAWAAKKKVVSVLGLDIAGAFDNVSHERLLWVLAKKGFPEWVVQMVESFLKGRRTRICFADYESEWINTETGIPQGSTLSPVLFLFFIADLLEEFQSVEENLFGFGFVDDTTLVTWSNSAAENCRRLTEAHKRCEAWAKRFGARFAPDKYQLIHFTKQKKTTEDIKSTVQVQGHDVELVTSLRVLGVWLDPKLSWKNHIEKAISKGVAAFDSLARITASTWGPPVRQSRLIYTAVARPAMTYGSQIWSINRTGNHIEPSKSAGLKAMQNRCLRKVIGAYKRAPVAAIERESGTPPVDLYIEALALQRAIKTADDPVTKRINETMAEIWESTKRRTPRVRGRGRPPKQRERQPTGIQRARKRGEELLKQRRSRADGPQRGRAIQVTSSVREIGEVFTEKWKERWQSEAGKVRRSATTWTSGWGNNPSLLYEGLQKHEATALFMLRTGVLGLRNWLAKIGVPGITPECTCGKPRQTLLHVWKFCPELEEQRAEFRRRTGYSNAAMKEILSTPAFAREAARWLLSSALLDQFKTAMEIEEEDMGNWAPFEL